MKWVSGLVLAAIALGQQALGQQIDLSILDKLASKAKSSYNVTLDEDKLKFASGFLSNDDPNQANAKSVVGKLKGINVRVFEFDVPGQFSASDLDVIRNQLRAPGWAKIVEAKERDHSAEIYMFNKDKEVGGIMIIAVERMQLSIVNIIGPVDIKSLGDLGGKFGIPREIPGSGAVSPPPPPAKRK